MKYAQILNNLVANVIELDDPSLVTLFAQGYDAFIPIDNINPIPAIGWSYNAYATFFTPPVAGLPVINTDVDQGNWIILQYSQSNSYLGINAAGQTSAFLSYNTNLFSYLSYGYLLDAIAELNTMIADTSSTKTNLSPFVTNDILTNYKYQIQDWLDIPNS